MDKRIVCFSRYLGYKKAPLELGFVSRTLSIRLDALFTAIISTLLTTFSKQVLLQVRKTILSENSEINFS